MSLQSVMIRYLREKDSEWSREERLLFTAGVFLLCDTDDFLDLQIAKGNSNIDSQIVDLILQSASPSEVGIVLREIGLVLPQELFRAHAIRAISQTNDFITLSYLGGAMYDYLQRHGRLFEVSPDLSPRLLTVNDSYARIVGLRLAALQSPLELSQFGRYLLQALERPSLDERTAAMNLIHDVRFYDFPQRVDLMAFPNWIDMKSKLEAIKGDGRDSYLSEIAERVLASLPQ